MSLFRRRSPKPDPEPPRLDAQRTADDLMTLVSSTVYHRAFDGPSGDVLRETFTDLPHLGALLGASVGVLSYYAMTAPDGPEAGLAELRRVLDTAIVKPRA